MGFYWDSDYKQLFGRRVTKVNTMLENIPLIAAATGVLGLLIAFVLYKRVNSVEIDNEVVEDITQEIQDGAMAFLLSLIHISEPTRPERS